LIERPDPDALLAGPLGEWLNGQESVRQQAFAKIRQRRRWVFIVTPIVTLLALIVARDIQAAVWCVLVVGGGGFAWAASAGAPVARAVKGQINGAVAQALGLEFSIACAPGEEWQRVKHFGMVPDYDNEAFEDRWAGTLGALPFQSYEAHCQEWQGSGKSRRLVTVFRGSVMSVGFTRRFHGVTLIEGDRQRTGWFGGEKEEISLWGGMKLQRCDMVDPTFEARFTVWGNDAVEARYLVHPEYVERITAVEQAFAGKNLRALFCGGELLILIETGNQFESGSLEAHSDRAMLVQTIEQFGALADLAHRLNEAPRGNFTPAASAEPSA
jgi:hypothetical protein